MLVYLLRHGTAENTGWHGPIADAERRLTPAGRAELDAAARGWRRCVHPLDRLYTSPLVRARDTAAVLAEAVGYTAAPAVADHLLPDGRIERALELILDAMVEGLESLALVGHQPHLGDLLGTLVSSGGHLPLDTGMLVGLRFDGQSSLAGRLVLVLAAAEAGRLG